MLFSWNYEVGSADGGDDGDDVDFEHPDSDGSFDFQGKTTVKALNLRSYVPTTLYNSDTVCCINVVNDDFCYINRGLQSIMGNIMPWHILTNNHFCLLCNAYF